MLNKMQGLNTITSGRLQSLASKTRVFFVYYKNCLVVNLLVSLMGAVISAPMGYRFPASLAMIFITAGYLFSIYLYDLRYQHQYFFYFNKGISRVELMLYTFILNLFVVGIAAILSMIFG